MRFLINAIGAFIPGFKLDFFFKKILNVGSSYFLFLIYLQSRNFGQQKKSIQTQFRYVFDKSANLKFFFSDFIFDKYISFNFFWNLKVFINKKNFSKKLKAYFSRVGRKAIYNSTVENFIAHKIKKQFSKRYKRIAPWLWK